MRTCGSFFLLLCLGTVVARAGDVTRLSPAVAAQRVADGKALLVDIREPDEWAETGVAAPAVLLPMSDFDEGRKLWPPFLEKNSGKELILYCRTGYRAGILARILAGQGRSVASAGSLDDWIGAGLPLRKVTPRRKTASPVSRGSD